MSAPLEKVEENKFVQKLRKCGGGDWLTRKLNGAGNRDWPDQLIIGPMNYHAMIEFKRGDEEARKTQEIKIANLRRLGHRVYLFNSCEEAFSQIKSDYMELAYNVK